MSRSCVFRSFVVVAFLVFAVARDARAAAPRGRDPALEQQIARELDALAPEATPIFQRATVTLDAGDLATAGDLFSKVLDLAPGFAPAERRRCGVLAQLGRRDEALPLCRSALAHDVSAPNQAALAAVLIATKGAPPPVDAAEAKRLAARASEAKPDDPYYGDVLVQASLSDNDLQSARQAVAHLQKVAPDDPNTDFLAAIVAGRSGDLDAAKAALDRAHEHGLPDATSADFAKAVDEARAGPWWLRAAKGLGWAVVAWLAALGLLLGAGYALSFATLRTVGERPTEADVRPSERRLRKAYRGVLWGACAYYYASLPLLAVVVVAAAVGLVLAILAAGYVAPKLFIILAIIAFGSLVAIAKSLFVRVRDDDPGITLDLDANPKMRAALDEVAGRIGTRPVDRVFVSPFTQVAVFDRGSLGERLRGSGERCLIVGAGVLDGMRVRAFKSVLAHEYGHFRNEDTAGGGFALGVRRSLSAMTMHLVARRAASALNPAWWFVRGFWRAFLGISQGASRLQEVLADRWAAFAYGSRDFEEGLRHVIERSVRFDAHLGAALDEVVKKKSALPNLYAFAPAVPPAEQDVENEVAKALEKKPTPFDSHPCPEDRLAWVRALAAAGVERAPDDDEDAWSLFADRTSIEARMTEDVRARIKARHGVVVPAA
jgi:Zn-dependent protease with chaperone function/Flp pilus assembly protein TadD